MTGFGGNHIVKTPNLDRLAAESAEFTRFYTPTPQPGPSRASLLTGQYPHKNGVTSDGVSLPAQADTFTSRLAAAGYTCSLIGHWNLKGVADSQPAFGFSQYPAATSQPFSWQNCDVWVDGKPAKADKFLTDWLADRAIEFLSRPHVKPFFLWVSFPVPGEPTVYPPGTERLYPPADVDLPIAMRDLQTDRPTMLNQAPAARSFQQIAEQTIREGRSKYYAMLSNLDANIGRLAQHLDAGGLGSSTVVVLTSEVGFACGDHRLVSVAPAFYDELIRCPLLIRRPGAGPAGVKIDRVVSLIDLAPTLLRLAGVDVPITIQGQSLLPLMADPETRRYADECFLEFDRQESWVCQVRGIIVRNYKFLDYASGTDGLYDLKHDPDEVHNVAMEPQYRVVLDVLKNRLQRWQQTTRDPLYRKQPS